MVGRRQRERRLIVRFVIVAQQWRCAKIERIPCDRRGSQIERQPNQVLELKDGGTQSLVGEPGEGGFGQIGNEAVAQQRFTFTQHVFALARLQLAGTRRIGRRRLGWRRKLWW